MAEESRRLYVAEELQQKSKQGQTIQSELKIIKPQLSNQIEKLESEVKTLQSELKKERSEKKRMQESHQLEVSDLQMQLKELKEKLTVISNDNLTVATEDLKKKETEVEQLMAVIQERNKELELLRATLRDFEHRVEQTRQDELSRTVAVQDLQCQLEGNMIMISNTEELLQKQELINAEKDQEIKEHDNMRMVLQQSICDLKDQLERRQEEILAGFDNIEEQPPAPMAELSKKGGKNRSYFSPISNLKKQNENLNEENEQNVFLIVQLEALCERQRVEKESLQQELQRLQESEKISNDNLTVTTENLKKNEGEVEQLMAAMEEKNKELQLLRATLRDFEHRVEQTRQSRTVAVQDLQCQLEENMTLIRNNKELLQKQEMIIAEKDQEIKEHDNIRMALQQSICDLKDQLERRQESHQLEVSDLQMQLKELKEKLTVISNDNLTYKELLQKQEIIIAEKDQEIKEHDNIRMALQQSICDLKDQLERRQEEILAGFENIGAEVPQASNFLDEHINDIPMQVAEEQPPAPMAELLSKKGENNESNSSQISNLKKDNKSLSEENRQNVSLPEEQPPAPMAQTTTFFRRCAGRVLKAGLTAGIVAAGIYTLGYLGSSNIQCMSSCVIEMIEPYCTKYDITPHPF
ncbi:unconventional myosin-Va-like isoform X3 [Larimichthys crocea]|uniref:unconventional myosin-Va-like isoform X2 n=1 Tax=Larimichthys crocea TaxID=215358 RepID=UPI000F5E2100|nr:unconventional myosin-Va-like isoform X2 [Larimichthys crocea]XP_027128999.1 unconventional myosin-Va-like isoform X3 [Larimichthys crocea]